ncbi:MAG: hypothetical protein IPK97_20905 [Ahniella sp.]|nr:hypothetical protein [Ahniella sp.]
MLDAGEDAQGQPYLVMEYIAGSTIRDHCRANGDDARARIAVVRAAAQRSPTPMHNWSCTGI